MTPNFVRISLACFLALPALAQSQKNAGNAIGGCSQTDRRRRDPGHQSVVISKCGACHTKDEKGNMLRISWERATPEGWEEAIKRMVRLRGVSLTPDEARSILKYLATYHGLAPEEAKPIMYYAEHRIQDETNIPNDNVNGACANCHRHGAAAVLAPLAGRLEGSRQSAHRALSAGRRGIPVGDQCRRLR